MFTAESNAVNLTDGLDGLCAGCCVIALFPYVIFALMEGHQGLGILLLCVIGALMGYLKFNLHPAKVFMGDTGSLALWRIARCYGDGDEAGAAAHPHRRRVRHRSAFRHHPGDVL